MRSAAWFLALIIGLFYVPQAHAQSGVGQLRDCDALGDLPDGTTLSDVWVGKIIGSKSVMAKNTMTGEKVSSDGLIPVGTIVIVKDKQNQHSCVVSSDGRYGWVPSEQIEAVKDLSIKPKDLIGEWKMGENYIDIKQHKGKIYADGGAYYHTQDGNTNIGNFGGEIKIDHEKIVLDEGNPEEGCGIILVFIVKTILALDPERKCDGMNVNFEGFYNKKH